MSRVSGDAKCGRDSGFRCKEFSPPGVTRSRPLLKFLQFGDSSLTQLSV
jgi:hypothetical protein